MMKRLTIVIKLGTSSIVDEVDHKPLIDILSLIVKTSVKLREQGHHVVVVSSGAIGMALKIMGLKTRPKHLPQVQALASIGQCKLMSLWTELFGLLDQKVSQILLTRNDIADRTQYLNAQNTLNELMNMGVIPIVNENDTLSVAEIKFGDNDTLSAITAGMIQADYLFLMTDVDCLYDKNPRKFPDAKPIEVVENIAHLEADVSSAGSSLGTGGMGTKITAARLATAAGVMTVITKSSKPGNVVDILNFVEGLKNREIATNSDSSLATAMETSHIENVQSSAPPHTRFLPDPHPIRDRHFWILGLAPHGTLFIDQGAHRALVRKAGLLPSGIVGVEGSFAQQEAVRIVVVERLQSSSLSGPAVHGTTSSTPAMPGNANATESPPRFAHERQNPAPTEVARAIVNYSAAEIKRIKGLQSSEIAAVLGYADSEYVALRENIALIG